MESVTFERRRRHSVLVKERRTGAICMIEVVAREWMDYPTNTRYYTVREQIAPGTATYLRPGERLILEADLRQSRIDCSGYFDFGKDRPARELAMAWSAEK